jgi:hypothetical protein
VPFVRSWGLRDRLWEHDVVERIRRGLPAPGAGTLGDGQPWLGAGLLHTGEAFFTDAGAIARQEAERKDRAGLRKAQAANLKRLAKIKADRLAMDAEIKANAEAHAKRAAEQARRRAEQDAEWAAAQEAEGRQREARRRQETSGRERLAILTGRWQCGECGSFATRMTSQGAGYVFMCTACKGTGQLEHDELVEMMKAAGGRRL